MIPDLSDIFARYEALVLEVDAVFAHIRNAHSDCVTCEPGCSDCCNALFDLSLVEAMYINNAFTKTIPHGKERSDILALASELDRKAVRMKRDFFRASKEGQSVEGIMEQAARLRLPCPLLNSDLRCILYSQRPITCRLYGVPLNINGTGHVCGKTQFSKGTDYPTVHMDAIQQRLDGLSRDIAEAVKSRFKELHQVYVPISMALMTNYNEQYLGIGAAKKE